MGKIYIEVERVYLPTHFLTGFPEIYYHHVIYIIVLFIECSMAIDIALLVDGSGSINRHGKSNFARMIAFLRSLVNAFKVSRRHTRVGLAIYNTRTYVRLRFNRGSSRYNALRAVGNLRLPGGGTRTGQALYQARRAFFPGRASKNRKRVLVLLTDGISQDSVKGHGRNLRYAGVEVFTVAVGRNYRQSQLQQIASDGSHIIKVSFKLLPTKLAGLQRRICRVVPSKCNAIMYALYYFMLLLYRTICSPRYIVKGN